MNTVEPPVKQKINCWQGFLSHILDYPAKVMSACSTDYPDWRETTDQFLAARGLFFIQVPIQQVTKLPDQSLVGLGMVNDNIQHVVVCRVHHVRGDTALTLEYDPAGRIPHGVSIPVSDYDRIMLFCKLFK